MPGSCHVIGAGLAGLAAGVALCRQSWKVTIHESAGFAGGRCRSYYDAMVGMSIDNGNHLLLSGNHAVLEYLRTIGADRHMSGPPACEYAFVDLASGKRWLLQINDGRFPFWIFDADKRVPDTRWRDYVSLARLMLPANGAAVGEVIDCSGPLYERFLAPLLRAALNVDPPIGSAKLAGAVARETVGAGGRACRPLVCAQGLAHALVDPAIDFLRRHQVDIRFGARVAALDYEGERLRGLAFEGADSIAVGAEDVVILAVPPNEASALVPGLSTPTQFHAIVNAHFRVPAATGLRPLTGILNGTAEWLFAFPQRLSTTSSAADQLLALPRQTIAEMIWRDVQRATGINDALPPWQIVRERRATFAATPAQEALRPGTRTAWRNLFLAGDWTDTGLPATMEGAVRSGARAASAAGSME